MRPIVIISGNGRNRNGSGSFLGPDESDDEIAFRGCENTSRRDSMEGYQR